MATRACLPLASLIVAALVAWRPSVAHADLHPPKQTSVTMSPVLAVFGVVELGVEWPVAPHWDVGTIAGLGRVRTTDGGRATVYELGAQASLYLRRNNVGWHLGLAARWADANVDLDDHLFIDEPNAGLSIGYKYVSSIGATILLDTGGTIFLDSRDGLRAAPLIRAEAGWSF